MDEQVVDDVIEEIGQHFPGLVVEKGNELTYLDMDIKFNKNKTIEVGTPQHIDEAIEAFGEDISGSVATPASKQLFSIDENSRLLDTRKQDVFHSVVARLLWIMKRARPDLETAVSFLCSRVTRSTEEDWGKLRRVLRFPKQTKNDKRVIEANNLHELTSWVDTSYAVHPNMRSHTGGVMSMGAGIMHAKSSKQKINVKSSTEAEIVGVSEYTPYTIHLRHFMEAQGYPLKKVILNQDNTSAMQMEKNGRQSCTGNSREG